MIFEWIRFKMIVESIRFEKNLFPKFKFKIIS